jgi:hypothetical protein
MLKKIGKMGKLINMSIYDQLRELAKDCVIVTAVQPPRPDNNGYISPHKNRHNEQDIIIVDYVDMFRA